MDQLLKAHRKVLLTALILALSFSLMGLSAEKPEDLTYVRVVQIIDGDTIRVKFENGEVEKMRYIGINTPEMREPVECYGEEATKYNRRLVEDKTLWLEFDVQRRDKYGRILSYAYLDPKGKAMVNAILVAQGYAQVATYPPNVRYTDLFLNLQKTAREHGLGLWCGCNEICPDTAPEDGKEEDDQTTKKPVEIACIHFDAGGNDSRHKNGEWVTLKASQEVNMSGWILRDEADHKYRFPDFTLPSGESVKIYTGSAGDPIPDEDRNADCGKGANHELYWSWSKFNAIWNNSGDTVYLESDTGETIDTCKYSGEGKEYVCQ